MKGSIQKLKTKISSEKGEIGESVITVTAIALAAILMFIFPLMTMADRTDEITQLAVETALAETADKVRRTGELTWDDYDKLVQDISATGNAYDISMTRIVRDENEAKKTAQAVAEKIGEDEAFTQFTSQIIDQLLGDEEKGEVIFNAGDMFSIAAKNSSTTLSQELKNFLYKVTGNDNYVIAAEKSVLVEVDGK